MHQCCIFFEERPALCLTLCSFSVVLAADKTLKVGSYYGCGFFFRDILVHNEPAVISLSERSMT